jgi:hypothetical protein
MTDESRPVGHHQLLSSKAVLQGLLDEAKGAATSFTCSASTRPAQLPKSEAPSRACTGCVLSELQAPQKRSRQVNQNTIVRSGLTVS